MELRAGRKGWAGAVFFFAFLLCLCAADARAAQSAECRAGRHQYAETSRIPATAAQDGEVTYLCGVCGQTYTEILYATDHLWGAWVIDTQPACTRAGERHRVCSRGQTHEEYDEIPPLGHQYEASVTKKPGCEEEGVTTFTCARCGGKYTKPIPATGHAYGETAAKEPSCLTPGVRRFVCGNNPAHSYEEEIAAIGSHEFGAWAVETPAGEGTQGLEVRVCARDGFKETRPLAALPVPGKSPVADILLVSANVGFLALFGFLLFPYLLCLRYIKKRRDAVNRRDALRKEVEEYYDFK